MTRTIFVNLPVTDVAASTAFYEAMGMVRDARFSNADAAAMAWSDAVVVGLLDRAFYATLTAKPIADTRATSAVLLCLSCESRAAVDATAEAALAAGGRALHGTEEHDMMYARAFEDPDGHGWQVMHMDAPPVPDGA